MIDLYECTVLPEWVDYNKHMSEAYYVLVFGFATDAFYELAGIGNVYREKNSVSVYTVEAHISYLDEIAEDEPIQVKSRIIAMDSKRIHLFHTMEHQKTRNVVAAEELMLLHVDTSGATKAVPFHAAIQTALKQLMEAQPEEEVLPVSTGGKIEITTLAAV